MIALICYDGDLALPSHRPEEDRVREEVPLSEK
jgi:hypothetical protein